MKKRSLLGADSTKEPKKETKKKKVSDLLLPTGSTLLNLALADDPYGGYRKGTIVNLVGDNSSGKTFLLWTLFAELVKGASYKDYLLYYDEPEAKLGFKLKELFGDKIDRVDFSYRSDTIQDWAANMYRVSKKDKPFIYGLDSFDSLTSLEEIERQEKSITKKEKTKGGYKVEKAIGSSELLRSVCRSVEDTDSLVIIISQVRQKLGIVFGKKLARSGGKALGHHATHEIWLAVKSHIKKRDRDIGVNVVAKTEKNHLTGKLRKVEFPIIFDYGVDDITSMIDFLIDEGFWSKKTQQTIDCKGDFPNATREKLIEMIEEENAEDELIQIVAESWNVIEDEIASNRKPRYV